MDNFSFNLNTKINFGSGSRKILFDIIKLEKLENLCVVIDHALTDIQIFSEFLDSLDIIKVLIKCEVSEPSYDDLEKNRKYLIGEKIDAFVGIGGGSALDMAKGLSVLFTNHKKAISYRGFEQFIPNKKVIGLSKINRLVDYFSHRPQVQERLSLQILKELQEALDTKDVIVMICAKHLCVSSRGIKDKSSFTTTIEYGGSFNDEQERSNFFKIIEGATQK